MPCGKCQPNESSVEVDSWVHVDGSSLFVASTNYFSDNNPLSQRTGKDGDVWIEVSGEMTFIGTERYIADPMQNAPNADWRVGQNAGPISERRECGLVMPPSFRLTVQ